MDKVVQNTRSPQCKKNKPALEGVRVIDLSRVLGGPFCTQILADHGAEVIKIEPPVGDDTRRWGPPFLGETASYFLGANRNKKAMSLDLRKQEAREILLSLLEGADILVENFKTGTLEQWGLGYQDCLSKRFPDLIHCRINGFGDDGPLGGLPGYDAVLQAMGGLMSVNGEEGGAPLRVGLPIVDMVAGMNAALGCLMALHERKASGLGQQVEASLFDSSLSLLHPHAANFFLSGTSPARSGNAHPNIAPYSSYQTASCPVFLAVGNDRQFAKLCQLIGLDDVVDDPRFATNQDRLQHRDILKDYLEEALKGFEGKEVAQMLIEAGVPAGPVLDLDEIMSHPHTDHRAMRVKIDDYEGLGSPIKLSRSKPSMHSAPPRFAQHNRAVLTAHGYDEAEIEALEREQIMPTR